MYYGGFLARFDTLDMKCILIYCTVLYIPITVSTLSTWEINLSMYAFDIFLLLILVSFDTHDMKCILIHCTVLYIQITVSTLSTWNPTYPMCKLLYISLWSFDTHDILLPLTSLIMVRFSFRLNRWNCLSVL